MLAAPRATVPTPPRSTSVYAVIFSCPRHVTSGGNTKDPEEVLPSYEEALGKLYHFCALPRRVHDRPNGHIITFTSVLSSEPDSAPGGANAKDDTDTPVDRPGAVASVFDSRFTIGALGTDSKHEKARHRYRHYYRH